ncbi:glycoside hydrolase family 3 protein [uncultured Imperialibacter sp.]|uniref:glycoside hydrolase family 3 protein n=1 Tax=uncultured Imperialibacter sp. TaxID=1672639 RepID=UPI0030DA6CB9|tara:strand:- start:2641 stop:3732 length:1092 start_codon:yes stop_codon:yes gene_type:complete
MKRLSFLFFYALVFSFKAFAQTDSLDIMIGQMIMIGLEERQSINKGDLLLQAIEDGKVGGVIYFEKNLTKTNTAENLRQLNNTLKYASAIPLWIAIDEEGGRVNRLKPKYGFVATKSAQELGRQGIPDSTYAQAKRMAVQLRELGFNLNFAPSVDVAVNPDNPVIVKLGRSFSSNADSVALHAAAFIKAHQEEGIVTSIKHFPGHGSSSKDTHSSMADVSNSWQFDEIRPFKLLIDNGRLDAVMSAHIVNAHLDPDSLPATLSKKIVQNILRDFIGFNGVVFSDDMQMHAISKHYGMDNAIELAINAGVDMLLICNNVGQTERYSANQIHQIIRSKVENGEISKDRIKQSYDRIVKLKRARGF